MSDDRDEKSQKKKSTLTWLKPLLFFIILAALITLAKYYHVGDKIGIFLDWVESLGNLGKLVYAAAYISATIVAAPSLPLSIAAGSIYGSVTGTILVSISSTVGASLCFLIARYFARDTVVKMLENKETFKRLDALTGEKGAIIVALTRLVPIFPYNILNYAFGLTSVSFKDYVLWSWLCMIPGTIMYVAGADALTQSLTGDGIPWPLIGIVLSIFVLITFIVKKARRKLKDSESALKE